MRKYRVVIGVVAILAAPALLLIAQSTDGPSGLSGIFGGFGFGGPSGPGGGRGPGGPGFGGSRPIPKPGTKVAVDDVKKYDKEGLYDPHVIRTIFLQFEDEDWEAELADFKPTDVEVPAQLIVEGKTYENVGVGFRGDFSFFMVGAGSKRSLNISMDLVRSDQRLLGFKSLNFLNSNGDGTLMRSVLYSHVANQFLPPLDLGTGTFGECHECGFEIDLFFGESLDRDAVANKHCRQRRIIARIYF